MGHRPPQALRRAARPQDRRMDDLHDPSPEETRQVMRKVAAYRGVCDHVRRRGTLESYF